MEIVKAVPPDVDAIKQIADAHRNELGFVRRPALLRAIDRSELFLATSNGRILGFVEYRHRQDDQTTLYNIVVIPEYQRTGIGRKLIQALIAEARRLEKQRISLKCPSGLTANEFYRTLGFQLYQTESGKQRQLNIWQWVFAESTS